MRTDQIFQKAEEVYGRDKQIVQAVEELSELQKELCKYFKSSVGIKCSYSRKKILDEIADVEIMLTQIKRYLKISQKELNEKKFCKVYELKRRLKEE